MRISDVLSGKSGGGTVVTIAPDATVRKPLRAGVRDRERR